LAGALLEVMPNGKSGIVVGSPENWTIGGDGLAMAPRPGDTFSKVSLKSAVHIDPFVPERAFDPALYDFGLAFNGVAPDLSARYRLVTVGEAVVIAAVSDPKKPPVDAAQTAAATPNRSNRCTEFLGLAGLSRHKRPRSAFTERQQWVAEQR
jgi:hypothetical protein